MGNLLLYLTFPLFWLMSLLPLSILYLLSDFISFLLYRVLQYRRDVVKTNLRNAFPGWDDATLSRTTHQFYNHLGDLIVENIKLFTMPARVIKERVRFEDPEFFKPYFDAGKNVIIVMGHTGNWEWAGAAMALNGPHRLQAVYRPVRSAAFDRLFRFLRSRFSAVPVPMASAYRAAIRMDGTPVATAFLADQSAPPEHACWINFLNQPTPVFRGVEKIALKGMLPVIFARVIKTARGQYQIVLNELNPVAESCKLTAAHTALLEETITDQPFNWLWSHRRWKHSHLYNSQQQPFSKAP